MPQGKPCEVTSLSYVNWKWVYMKVMLLNSLMTRTATVSLRFRDLGFVFILHIFLSLCSRRPHKGRNLCTFSMKVIDDLTDEKVCYGCVHTKSDENAAFPIHFHCDLPGSSCSGCWRVLPAALSGTWRWGWLIFLVAAICATIWHQHNKANHMTRYHTMGPLMLIK